MNEKFSILIVDDEPDNFDVIETLLAKQGYQLHYASSGQKALDRLEKIPIDLILLDVMMPELDGIEVCRKIKTNPKYFHIPIIIVTALTAKEDLARCLELGADDFISKPVSGVELRARIHSLLRIKQQHDALKTSLKLREEMANMIVHDLRNPLTNIIAACDLLKILDLPEQQKQWLELIEHSGKNIECMLDSLLIMAKLEAQQLRLNLSDVNLGEMVQTAVNDFQAMAILYEIKLLAKVKPQNKLVKVDCNLLRRVIDNLITNAIKYSPADSQVIVEVDYPKGKQARIRVSDQGAGVSEEFKKRLFEKFEIGPSLYRNVKQTGLGLTFCQLAISRHGGTITVEDNQPKGAIFTVELPEISSEIVAE